MSHAARTLLVTAALVGLSACASKVPDRIDKADTPTEHFQARAVESTPEMQLAVHGQGLSPAQTDALSVFVVDWAAAEGGSITIQVPSRGADSGASFRTAEGARSRLIAQGVPADRIVTQGYEPAEGAPGVVKLSYRRYEVVTPSCGKVWTNLARTASNDVQGNFGCAVTANFAAQLANPGDLVRPRDTTPADAGRRATVLEKYRRGEATSSAKDDQAKGAVSDRLQ